MRLGQNLELYTKAHNIHENGINDFQYIESSFNGRVVLSQPLLYFRAKLIRIENVILTKRFVSVVVVNENSTPHNAFGISKEFTVYEYKLPHQTV